MNYGWRLLTDEEEKEVWSRFIKAFHPTPSKSIFPSYIPTPFIQYDISNCYMEEFIQDFEDISKLHNSWRTYLRSRLAT